MDSDFNRNFAADRGVRLDKASARKAAIPSMENVDTSDRWDLAPQEVGFLCYALKMAQGELQDCIKSIIDQYSLGPRGGWMVGLIGKGMVFPSDLTRMLKIGRSLVTAELNRLTEAGLIEARQNEEDGRRVELRLTAEGERASDLLGEALSRLISGRLASYTRDEKLLFARMLRDFSLPGLKDGKSLRIVLQDGELRPGD